MAQDFEDAPGAEAPPPRWRFIEEERPRRRARRADTSGDGASPSGPPPARRNAVRWLGPLGRYGRRVGRRFSDPRTRTGSVLLLGAAVLLVLFCVFWVRLVLSLPSEAEIRAARYAQASVIYTRFTNNDERDELEITRFSDESREWVPLDSISPYVVSALVATEDRRFFRHSGVDFTRLGSSIVKTATGDPQGASTITMQFARNAFPDLKQDFTLTRKIKEWILAYSLEDYHSKEDILEMYLNTVPFLYNAFGIEAASKTYFGKRANDLTVDEAATLIGMLKGTAYYNPIARGSVPGRLRHPMQLDQTERSLARRNVVLHQIVVNRDVLEEYSREFPYLAGFEAMTEETYQRMAETPTRLAFRPLDVSDRVAPYFSDAARAELERWAEPRSINPYTAGLRVYTTLDPTLQQAAEKAVAEQAVKLQRIADQQWGRRTVSDSSGSYTQDPVGSLLKKRPELMRQFVRQSNEYGDLVRGGMAPEQALDSLVASEAFGDTLRVRMKSVEAAFIAIEPGTRRIRAYVGGRGFADKQYDHVSQARRQPGSTFKMFVYSAALESGKFTPTSSIRDGYTCREPDGTWWRPTSMGSNGGTFQLKEALKWSKNGAAVNLMMSIGSRSQDCGGSAGPQRVAELARRNGLSIPEACVVPSLALGICEVTLLQLTNAYATLADGGKMRTLRYIERIEDANGRVIAEFGPSAPRQTIHPRVAYDVLDMMRGVVRAGTGQAIQGYLGNPGFDLAGKTGTTQHGSDGWFMLMHPNLVMGAWVGFDTPTVSWRSDYYQQGSHTALPIVGGFFRQIRQGSRRALLDPDAKFAAVTVPLPKPANTKEAATTQTDQPARRARPRPRAAPVEAAPEPPSDVIRAPRGAAGEGEGGPARRGRRQQACPHRAASTAAAEPEPRGRRTARRRSPATTRPRRGPVRNARAQGAVWASRAAAAAAWAPPSRTTSSRGARAPRRSPSNSRALPSRYAASSRINEAGAAAACTASNCCTAPRSFGRSGASGKPSSERCEAASA